MKNGKKRNSEWERGRKMKDSSEKKCDKK